MSKIIESIKYFPAGYCTSNLALLFKGQKRKKMVFPAGVYLLKHREHGYILYDTANHMRSKANSVNLYTASALRMQMKKEDQIDCLLQGDWDFTR